jgi:hypothetical protein
MGQRISRGVRRKLRRGMGALKAITERIYITYRAGQPAESRKNGEPGSLLLAGYLRTPGHLLAARRLRTLTAAQPAILRLFRAAVLHADA